MAEAFAREVASKASTNHRHGAFWVEMHLTVEMKPLLDTYAQVTILSPPLLHGHTLGGFSSQGSVPQWQTRPASCPHLL